MEKVVGSVSAVLITGCVVTLAMSLSPVAGNERAHHKVNVGLQLYSLRVQFPKDVPGTMAEIEKWGISDVEAASFYGLSAREFREQLDQHHLHASGAHFEWERFASDIDGVIRDAHVLGCKYVTVPWIPHNGTFTLKHARMAVKSFNEWGAKCRAAGLSFTYHPHGYEFKTHGDGTLFDVIAQETKAEDVNFELDIFWAYDGGADPVKLMRNYPTRFKQMHLKDMNKSVKRPNYTGHENVNNDVTLGTGQLDLPAILAEAEEIGIRHYYIEDESDTSERQIPRSIRYIRSIGF